MSGHDSDDSVSEEEQLIGGQSVHPYVTELFGSVIQGVQAGNDLPEGDDYEFYRSFRQFPKVMSEYGTMLMGMVESVSRVYTPELAEASGDKTEAMVEFMDMLFENIDGDLEILKTEASRSKMTAEEKARRKQLLKTASSGGGTKVKQDNSPTPFRPFVVMDPGNVKTYPVGTHPFAKDIEKLQSGGLMDWQLLPPTQPVVFPQVADSKFTYIDQPAQLQKLAKQLLTEQVIAIDLEHHSLHSFQGFTCLMQISTRTNDYVVDTIELRKHMPVLLTSFANRNVLKVLHGCSSDIEWLQRDFGLYIVNCFDTGEAAQQLGKPHGLGALLRSFSINVDKRYQNADWRVRPLPEEMLLYARLDTHYLIALYDKLKFLLLQQAGKGGVENPLHKVYLESNALCLRMYKKPAFDDDYLSKVLSGRLDEGVRTRYRSILKTIFEWRDEVARLEDESYGSVLPDPSAVMLAVELDAIEVSTRNLQKFFSSTKPFAQKHAAKLVERIEMEQQKQKHSDMASLLSFPREKKVLSSTVLKEFGWVDQAASVEELWHVDKQAPHLRPGMQQDLLYGSLDAMVEGASSKELMRHFDQSRAREKERRRSGNAGGAPGAPPTAANPAPGPYPAGQPTAPPPGPSGPPGMAHPPPGMVPHPAGGMHAHAPAGAAPVQHPSHPHAGMPGLAFDPQAGAPGTPAHPHPKAAAPLAHHFDPGALGALPHGLQRVEVPPGAAQRRAKKGKDDRKSKRGDKAAKGLLPHMDGGELDAAAAPPAEAADKFWAAGPAPGGMGLVLPQPSQQQQQQPPQGHVMPKAAFTPHSAAAAAAPAPSQQPPPPPPPQRAAPGYMPQHAHPHAPPSAEPGAPHAADHPPPGASPLQYAPHGGGSPFAAAAPPQHPHAALGFPPGHAHGQGVQPQAGYAAGAQAPPGQAHGVPPGFPASGHTGRGAPPACGGMPAYPAPGAAPGGAPAPDAPGGYPASQAHGAAPAHPSLAQRAAGGPWGPPAAAKAAAPPPVGAYLQYHPQGYPTGLHGAPPPQAWGAEAEGKAKKKKKKKKPDGDDPAQGARPFGVDPQYLRS
eukprot:TRINITY_DN1370_c0_g1_i2.p1 TRINITY_DN1370_c0_g1~~TRINITY_DN1370_c0_g1_i2.p1  ORF type:complete len:1065 (+),score=397.55 TRINITY_DN1370_c0_g1_i2:61-3255(+)